MNVVMLIAEALKIVVPPIIEALRKPGKPTTADLRAHVLQRIKVLRERDAPRE